MKTFYIGIYYDTKEIRFCPSNNYYVIDFIINILNYFPRGSILNSFYYIVIKKQNYNTYVVYKLSGF